MATAVRALGRRGDTNPRCVGARAPGPRPNEALGGGRCCAPPSTPPRFPRPPVASPARGHPASSGHGAARRGARTGPEGARTISGWCRRAVA
eukprot:scaffold1233_cov395-Prasinococcus_capsulatus_cf.AAC.31